MPLTTRPDWGAVRPLKTRKDVRCCDAADQLMAVFPNHMDAGTRRSPEKSIDPIRGTFRLLLPDASHAPPGSSLRSCPVGSALLRIHNLRLKLNSVRGYADTEGRCSDSRYSPTSPSQPPESHNHLDTKAALFQTHLTLRRHGAQAINQKVVRLFAHAVAALMVDFAGVASPDPARRATPKGPWAPLSPHWQQAQYCLNRLSIRQATALGLWVLQTHRSANRGDEGSRLGA